MLFGKIVEKSTLYTLGIICISKSRNLKSFMISLGNYRNVVVECSRFSFPSHIIFFFLIYLFLYIACLFLQLIENWIRSVISDRNGGAHVEKSQVTLIWAVAVAIFCFGGMVGGLMTGIVAEKFGRKGGLLVSNSLVVISALLQGNY